MLKKNLLVTLVLSSLLIASGCSTSGGSAPAAEAYIQALVARDDSRLANLSCAAWEADAKNEIESFSAVSIELSDLSCQETSKDGNSSLVNCSGKIVANYNGEILEIDLSQRTYRLEQEGGDWRMCGYQ